MSIAGQKIEDSDFRYIICQQVDYAIWYRKDFSPEPRVEVTYLKVRFCPACGKKMKVKDIWFKPGGQRCPCGR